MRKILRLFKNYNSIKSKSKLRTLILINKKSLVQFF